VLQHELGILRGHTTRPAMRTVDRLFLAAASRLLPRSRWRSFIMTPTTLLRWHRLCLPSPFLLWQLMLRAAMGRFSATISVLLLLILIVQR
jgi:hypothetical protein